MIVIVKKSLFGMSWTAFDKILVKTKFISLIMATSMITATSLIAQNTNLGTGAGHGGSANTSIGHYAGDQILGINNTFLGHLSGYQTGKVLNNNTFTGAYSGYNSRGNDNTFTGVGSGYLTLGDGNSFFGSKAGQKNLDGSHNTFIGMESGLANVKASNNTFTGYRAGYNNEASDNTFYGNLAGLNNSTGTSNSFIGPEAGHGNITGSNNTFSGHRAGYNNNGDYNAFYGTMTGYNNTTGQFNTFIGFKTGYSNTDGNRNTYIGNSAGYNGTTGKENVFIGHGAGRDNIHDGNTFIGSGAGAVHDFGVSNVFVGRSAGFFHESGNQNVFMGSSAGHNAYNGGLNVYIGEQAGFSNDGGNHNVYIGSTSGQYSVGSRNVFIGNESGRHVSSSDKLYIQNTYQTDPIPLIYGDFVTKSVAIASTNPGLYRLYVNGDAFATGVWVASDKKFKKNIKDIKTPLAKVHNMNGKIYEYKDGSKSESKEGNVMHFPEGKQFGFIAQELKEIIPEAVIEHTDGTLAVNYNSIIPILVEAIKELSHQQQNQLDYKNKINFLEQKVEHLEQTLSGKKENISSDVIEDSQFTLQNVPNPANGKTTIIYSVPEGTVQVSILVFDLQGKLVKSYDNLPTNGAGIDVSSTEIGTGMFNYALILDGKLKFTSKMILQ